MQLSFLESKSPNVRKSAIETIDKLNVNNRSIRLALVSRWEKEEDFDCIVALGSALDRMRPWDEATGKKIEHLKSHEHWKTSDTAAELLKNSEGVVQTFPSCPARAAGQPLSAAEIQFLRSLSRTLEGN